jgi:hypothetical protein
MCIQCIVAISFASGIATSFLLWLIWSIHDMNRGVQRTTRPAPIVGMVEHVSIKTGYVTEAPDGTRCVAITYACEDPCNV